MEVTFLAFQIPTYLKKQVKHTRLGTFHIKQMKQWVKKNLCPEKKANDFTLSTLA